MTKKKLALEIIERLRTAYPDADCTLDYDHSEAWKLLVGVRLAAQCTDERVNIVVKNLYAKFPDVNALAEADPQEIEAIVRPVSYTHLDVYKRQQLHRDRTMKNFLKNVRSTMFRLYLE